MENQTQVQAQEVVFVEGATFVINGRNVGGKNILKDRLFQFTKTSKKPGMVNGHLINPKNGKLQKTEIAIPIELLEKMETQPAKVEEVIQEAM